jgi:hypothetical protein
VHTIDDTRLSHDVVLGDLDGDGHLDLVTETAVYLSDGRGELTARPDAVRRDGKGTLIADLDCDGTTELLVVRAERLLLVRPPHGEAARTGRWPETDLGPAWERTEMVAGDVTGDGVVDLVISSMYGTEGLWLMPGLGGLRFGERELIDGSVGFVHQGSAFLRDLDGDGRLDLLLVEMEQSLTGRLMLLRNEDRGRSWRRQVLATTGGHNPKVGDVDGDGRLDLLNANHGYYGAPTALELWRGVGAGA